MELRISVGASPGGRAHESLARELRDAGEQWEVTLGPPVEPLVFAPGPAPRQDPGEQRDITVLVAGPGDTAALAQVLGAWLTAHTGRTVTVSAPGSSLVLVLDVPGPAVAESLALLLRDGRGEDGPHAGDAGTHRMWHVTGDPDDAEDVAATPPGPPFGEGDEW